MDVLVRRFKDNKFLNAATDVFFANNYVRGFSPGFKDSRSYSWQLRRENKFPIVVTKNIV